MRPIVPYRWNLPNIHTRDVRAWRIHPRVLHVYRYLTTCGGMGVKAGKSPSM